MLRVFRLFLTVAAIVSFGVAGAQTLPQENIDSLDAQVLNATSITVGTLKAENGDSATFTVDETLRGAAKAEVTGKLRGAPALLDQWRRPTPPGLIENWRRRATPLLILVEPDNGAIDVIDLPSATSPNRYPATRATTLPVSTKDFRVLSDREAILKYVRKLLQKNPKVTKIGRMAIPPPESPLGEAWKKAVGFQHGGDLIVPVDEALEKRAFEYVYTKDWTHLYHAIQMLRPFKSEGNIERLKKMLDDGSYWVTIPAERFRGIELRDYPVRQAATQTLEAWGVSFPKTETRERASKVDEVTQVTTTLNSDYEPDFTVLRGAKRLAELTVQYGEAKDADLSVIASLGHLTRLTINRARLDDRRLDFLNDLKNLRYLDLSTNPIGDAGLGVLRGLKNLKEVRLSGTSVTEAGIAELQRARPDLRVVV